MSLNVLQVSDGGLIQPKKPLFNRNQPLANIMRGSIETNEAKDADSKFARRPVESDIKDASETTKSPPAVVQRGKLLVFSFLYQCHSHGISSSPTPIAATSRK